MTIANLLLALLATTANAAADRDRPLILDFTATWCGPCQQMKPAVEDLARKGYPIKPVDIDRYPELAQRYNVTGVPTFIVVEPNGRELGRISGARPANDLASLYRKSLARFDQRQAKNVVAQADSPEETGEELIPNQDEAEDQASPTPGRQDHAENGAEAAKTDSPYHPWETVVRIKIINHLARPRPVIGYGSGTLIYSTPEESIILTCAHIFHIDGVSQQPHPSRFPLKIRVDLFDGKLSGTRTPQVHPTETDIPGEAIDYDFAGDVGLIRIRPGRRLPFSRVVPADWTPREKMPLTTVGCSEGNDATAWSTWVTRPHIRLQTEKGLYDATECAYPPKQGRSGGGLFTLDGLVAGVCDFNDGPRGAHGLYASPKTIHRMLDRNKTKTGVPLTVCYASPDRLPSRSDVMIASEDRPARSRVPSIAAASTAGAGASKLRAQSPQVNDRGMIPIPPPELMNVHLPEITEVAPEPDESGFPASKGRSHWKPAPAPEVSRLASAATDHRSSSIDSSRSAVLEREPEQPRTTRLEISPSADSDLFASAPDLDTAPSKAPTSKGVNRSSQGWRSANPSRN